MRAATRFRACTLAILTLASAGALQFSALLKRSFAAPRPLESSPRPRDDGALLTSARARRDAQTVFHRVARDAARSLSTNLDDDARLAVRLRDAPAALQNNVLLLPRTLRALAARVHERRAAAGERAAAAPRPAAPSICLEGHSVLALYQ